MDMFLTVSVSISLDEGWWRWEALVNCNYSPLITIFHRRGRREKLRTDIKPLHVHAPLLLQPRY